MALFCCVLSNDNFLGANLSRIVTEEGIRNIRTADLSRGLREIKRPWRLSIIDMAWEAVQERGALRQYINISRISGNKVVCICPNQDEDLKKLAAQCRPDEIFIRYDLETRFRAYLKEVQVTHMEESKEES